MRTLLSLWLLLLFCPSLLADEGKTVSARQVPEPVKAAVAKAIPEAVRHEYRLLDNGNYLGQAANAREPKSAEVGADGSLVRVSEPVAELPTDAQKRVDVALKENKVSAKPRAWRKITEAGDQRVYFQAFAGQGRSTYDVRVGVDGKPATVSLIETRLNGGKGPRVRVSGGGSIVP